MRSDSLGAELQRTTSSGLASEAANKRCLSVGGTAVHLTGMTSFSILELKSLINLSKP